MARNPRQAALYEVINRSKFRDAQLKALERIGAKPKFTSKPQVVAETKLTEEPKQQESVKIAENTVPVIAEQPVADELGSQKPDIPEKIELPVQETVKQETIQPIVKQEVVKKPAKPEIIWTARPKPVRVFADRIELCLTWPIAGVSILALVAVMLVAFKLGGQMNMTGQPEVKPQQPAVIRVDDIKPKAPDVPAVALAPVENKPPKLVEPMGENAIVIASHSSKAQLEPVQQYFAQFGIATEIYKPAGSSRFLLVTQNRYDNIEKPGTEGNEMKKKIMAIGANSGLQSFGPKPFQDIYGMKIKSSSE